MNEEFIISMIQNLRKENLTADGVLLATLIGVVETLQGILAELNELRNRLAKLDGQVN